MGCDWNAEQVETKLYPTFLLAATVSRFNILKISNKSAVCAMTLQPLKCRPIMQKFQLSLAGVNTVLLFSNSVKKKNSKPSPQLTPNLTHTIWPDLARFFKYQHLILSMD